MRYALISDIHANVEALTSTLREIERARVDQIVCLGDLVGYNAAPEECVRLVCAVGAVCVAGNHDRAVVGALSTRGFGPAARHAVDWSRDRMSTRSRRFLSTLPTARRLATGEWLVHGALHPQPNERLHLSTPVRVAASLAVLASGSLNTDVCFFGHTHRPVAYYLPRMSAGRPEAHETLHGPRIIATRPGFYLMNPGSVGQSRDGDPRASFAIWDTGDRCFEIRRVAYDAARAERSARERGLDSHETAWQRSLRRFGDAIEDGRDLTRRALRKAFAPGLFERGR